MKCTFDVLNKDLSYVNYEGFNNYFDIAHKKGAV